LANLWYTSVMRSITRTKKAITLVEVLIIVAIIFLLGSVVGGCVERNGCGGFSEVTNWFARTFLGK